VFRYQVYDRATGLPDGDVAHRYLGRALLRVIELNIFEQADRFSVRPVRVRS
jgi:hypothetical protein